MNSKMMHHDVEAADERPVLSESHARRTMTAALHVLYAERRGAEADLTRAHFARVAPDIALDVVDSGARCLARLAEGSYDALLLDHRLPDMDGVAVLVELAVREVQLPVVMMTGEGDEPLFVQALAVGPCDYVPKHTNFRDSLPAALKRVAAESHMLQGPRPTARRQRRRILYVEQGSAAIHQIVNHLAQVAPRFSLEVARSSADALTLLQAYHFDLLLMNLRTPDMNALDLLRETRHRGLQIPVVVMTDRGDERAGVAALDLGASDYVVKRDDDLSRLPYAIDHAIARFELGQLKHHLLTSLAARLRSQQATAESLALLDTLQRHAPIGIAFTDRDYRFSRVNDELAAINGLPAEAHIGRTVGETVPDIWPQLEPVYRRVLAGESVVKLEMSGQTVAKPGEERHWVSSFYPVRGRNQDVIGIGVFVSEITERKRAEAVLREQAEAVAETARQKDEFLAMLGHELRNPLAPIRTALALLRQSGSPNPVAVRAHDVMDRQITHMVRLLDDLLDVARITNGRINLTMQQVDVRQVVAEAIDSVRGLIDARHHHVETALPPGPLIVRGDVTRLVQVVVNLLNNAAKYTDEHGTIRVTAATEHAHAVLRVTDTGTGIPARLLPKIFDLFTQDDRTLDRAQGGLGLGLTLVRRISELHGGTVEARSEGRGRGSEFIVKLPLAGAEPVASVPDTNLSEVSRPPIRCLLVEDNVDAAQMLQCALELHGHEVRLAFDGRDAVDAARTFKPDAVVLDIGLPRMNGYDVAREIRRLPGLADIIIVAVTGYGQDADRRKSCEAGCDHHLVKPIELNQLLRVLGAGRAVSSRQ
jgi:PAS domain S-box-containing protein